MTLWIKTGDLSNKSTDWQFEVSIIDSANNYGIYRFSYWSNNSEWQQLTCFANSYQLVDPQTPNLNDIVAIRFRLINRESDKPMAISLGGIQIVKYEVQKFVG
jgi:hypothetical protein